MFDQKMHLGASGPLCVCKTKEEVEVKDRTVQIKSLLLMVRWNYFPSLCLILNKNMYEYQRVSIPYEWHQNLVELSFP